MTKKEYNELNEIHAELIRFGEDPIVLDKLDTKITELQEKYHNDISQLIKQYKIKQLIRNFSYD